MNDDKQQILIVDDDYDLALGMAMRLKAHGYRILTAQDSIGALALAKNNQPDLIILDLGLPGGSGFEFLTRMRGLMTTALIPVIVLTARDISNKERALDAGAQAFFQKPVENDDLIQAIDRLI